MASNELIFDQQFRGYSEIATDYTDDYADFAKRMSDISAEYKTHGKFYATSYFLDEINYVSKSNKSLMNCIIKYKNYCIENNINMHYDTIEKELAQCVIIDKKYDDLNKAVLDYFNDYENVSKVTNILNIFKDIYETYGGPGSCTFID
jgi:hypothetical protein